LSRVGTVFDVKGFIMNKFFEKGYVTAGTHHGKHVSITDLRTNYPSQHHGLFSKAIEELRKGRTNSSLPGKDWKRKRPTGRRDEGNSRPSPAANKCVQKQSQATALQ